MPPGEEQSDEASHKAIQAKAQAANSRETLPEAPQPSKNSMSYPTSTARGYTGDTARISDDALTAVSAGTTRNGESTRDLRDNRDTQETQNVGDNLLKRPLEKEPALKSHPAKKTISSSVKSPIRELNFMQNMQKEKGLAVGSAGQIENILASQRNAQTPNSLTGNDIVNSLALKTSHENPTDNPSQSPTNVVPEEGYKTLAKNDIVPQVMPVTESNDAMIILFNEKELVGISLSASTQAMHWVMPEALLTSNSPKLKLMLDTKEHPEAHAGKFNDRIDQAIWDPKTSKKIKHHTPHKAIYFQVVLRAARKKDEVANQLSSMETSDIGKALDIWVGYIKDQTPIKIDSFQQKDRVLLLGKWLGAKKNFMSAVIEAYIRLPERDHHEIVDLTEELMELLTLQGRWP